MTYLKLLEELNRYKEEKFAAFQRRLIATKQTILGVRTPTLRKLAKAFKGIEDKLFAFPDEFFEVTMIKLTAIAQTDYETFVSYVERCVALMDNWGACDTFKPKCLKKNATCFLPVLRSIFDKGDEYSQRYALVLLLSYYVEEAYLPLIETYLTQANTAYYYVHMAAAWLTAEVLVKYYETGVSILQKGLLEKKTHNKAIQKAIESYRLTNDQKDYLRSLKIK